VGTWSFGGLLLLALVNVVLYNHAYHFTHFAPAGSSKTGRPEEFSFGEKMSLVLTGIRNPKPRNVAVPQHPYPTVSLRNERQNRLEAWLIETPCSRGTVVMFHGYTSTKAEVEAIYRNLRGPKELDTSATWSTSRITANSLSGGRGRSVVF